MTYYELDARAVVPTKCNKTTRSGNSAANGNEYTVPPTTDGYDP